jgi:hypothetical protein
MSGLLENVGAILRQARRLALRLIAGRPPGERRALACGRGRENRGGSQPRADRFEELAAVNMFHNRPFESGSRAIYARPARLSTSRASTSQ